MQVTATGTRRAGAAASALTAALVLLATGSCASSPDPPVPAASSAARAIDREGLRRAVDGGVATGSASYGNIEAVLVRVNGQPILDRYWNSDASTYRNAFSVTKSIVSTLVGIALQEGILTGMDQTLADSLPEYRPIMSDDVAAITLAQLLTMTSGIGGGAGTETPEIEAPDHIAEVLRIGTSAAPGTAFQYSDNAANVLAAVLTEALRRHDGARPRSLLDYGRQKLFDPIGIPTRPAYTGVEGNRPFSRAYEAAGFGWSTDRKGRFSGDAMIRLRAVDLAALGQLFLDDGRWEGRQILPEGWVRDATTPIELAAYGRLWWTLPFGTHDAYAAFGRGGQVVLVVPDLRLVVAVAARFDPTFDLRPEDVVNALLTTAVLPYVA